MTEQKSIEILNQIASRNVFCTLEKTELDAFGLAISALEEIQRYRSLGTVEEIKKMKQLQNSRREFYQMGYKDGVLDANGSEV